MMALGLKALYRKKESTTDMARALTWRVALSIGLFLLLLLSFQMGWITPNQIEGNPAFDTTAAGTTPSK
ncbi:MAG TPA: DUF2909 domain-containing protein [Gammaproteobacteria bacterium]|nr:DUF2909 domain-containing protein [Gammaproteobacteria bacterium]